MRAMKLSDRTRRPYRYANQLPEQVEAAVVAAKREKPHWGARKIRERLLRRLPHAVKIPACSTIHAVLDRHGLVQSALRRRRYKAEGTVLTDVKDPNDLWCADYKGEFMLADRRYCYPLTITDFASRYLLRCEALSTTQTRFAFTVFEPGQGHGVCGRDSALRCPGAAASLGAGFECVHLHQFERTIERGFGNV